MDIKIIKFWRYHTFEIWISLIRTLAVDKNNSEYDKEIPQS